MADLREAHILAVGGVGGAGGVSSGSFGEIFSQPKTEARILFTTTMATPLKQRVPLLCQDIYTRATVKPPPLPSFQTAALVDGVSCSSSFV